MRRLRHRRLCNYLGGDEGTAGLKAAYGAKPGARRRWKAKFDLTNLFRMNRTTCPASVVGTGGAAI
jgi:hypothetical protein